MTIHHPIRRTLARVCSAATMARVVDPVLADIRWERGPRWLGYLALARALALHAAVSLPGALTHAWRGDGFAMPRMAMWTLAAAVIFTLPMIAPAFQTPDRWPALLLIPQGVAWTLPPVLLLAVPAALRGRAPNARLALRTIALSFVLIAVTFGLLLWIAPAANEAYRQAFAPLMQGEAVEFPNWSAAAPARLLDYQFHQRLAFGTAALPFALLGLALTTCAVARRRPWLFGGAAAAFSVFVAFPLVLWTSALLLRASAVPPFVLAWTPNVAIFAIGSVMLARESVIGRPESAE